MRTVQLTNNSENFISATEFKVGDIAVYIKRNKQYISIDTLRKLMVRDILKETGREMTVSSEQLFDAVNGLPPGAGVLTINPFDRQKIYRRDIEFVRFISTVGQVSVNNKGRIRIGTRMCEGYKKADIVKVANEEKVSLTKTGGKKKTIKELCSDMKIKVNLEKNRNKLVKETRIKLEKIKIKNVNKTNLRVRLNNGEDPKKILKVARQLAKLV
jgi:hypothetical protein